MSNSAKVMAEYYRDAAEFRVRLGMEFPTGGKDYRKILNEIAESGRVDMSEGSLKEGLQIIDRAAEIARRH